MEKGSGSEKSMSLNRSWLSRGILLVCLETLIVQGCLAQQYPKWFLNQLSLGCKKTAVGYANPSFFPDSSAARAFRNGCETYIKQRQTNVFGGQAFWSTEIGTFWMGSDFQEQFDTVAVAQAVNHLQALDTLITQGFVAVLLSNLNCLLDTSLQERQSTSSLPSPSWLETLPYDETYYYAIGVAPEYFYETSSWTEAERLARRNLARVVYIDVKALQKITGQGQEIRHEEISVTLRDIQTVARWRDMENKIFYVLIRMPKQLGLHYNLHDEVNY